MNFITFINEYNNELNSLYEKLKNYDSELLEKLDYNDFCRYVFINFY